MGCKLSTSKRIQGRGTKKTKPYWSQVPARHTHFYRFLCMRCTSWHLETYNKQMNASSTSRLTMTRKALLVVVSIVMQATASSHSYSNAYAHSHFHPPIHPNGHSPPLDVAVRNKKVLEVTQQEKISSIFDATSEAKNSISSDRTASASLAMAGSGESLSAQLRRDLLANYDRGSYPWEYAWNSSSTPGRREGTPVELGIVFHRVFEVDVTTSAADLVVWVRQKWTDPRLRWDPKEYGGIDKAWFWIGDGGGSAGETSEIWSPDLKLWNQRVSLDKSLVDTHAQVTSDGVVYWSRPGHMQPVCKFRGLNHFPFDELLCTLELGSWAYSGLYLRPEKFDEGFVIGGSDTAGEAYAEYQLLDVACEEHIYPPFPGAPEEDWPVLFYHLTFKRAWEPYARGYITIQIILNLAAFTCFWLPPHIGERMSLSITSMLAAVASELVVSSKLPPASEMTWVAKFSLVSLIFAALALFESAAVIYFYYHTGSSITPKWLQKIKQKCSKKKMDEEVDEEDVDSKISGRPRNTPYGLAMAGRNKNLDRELEENNILQVCNNVDVSDSSGGDLTTLPAGDAEDIEEKKDIEEEKQPESKSSLKSDNSNRKGLPVKFSASTHSGTHSEDSRPSLCVSSTHSARKRVKTIMGRDAEDFKDLDEMKNNYRWQKVSVKIDNIARVLFPVAYSMFILFVFTGKAFD